jgi:transcriptional regulator with XRE-family HTH domain
MLGDELRKAREQAGLTQEKLAFESGIGRPYISQLEHNRKSPTVETLFRICRACGVRASAVIAAVEEKHAAKAKGRTGQSTK